MSNSVDQRIVQMQFDNAQFEKGVATTLSSIKALDQSLQMKTGVSGLELVDAAASKLSFAGLISDANSLNDVLSTIGTVGLAAISRVSNAVMDLGSSMVRALTVDPLTDGLDEYKLKMDSITTIMSNTKSKGTTLDDVNATLADLNEYADLTIYNFAEMTRNIGTFTAAGVDLKTSASAIKGIANLAAVSGSNSQQASIAMYQLSQALASGTVKLMDWNSVLNAGMGGQVFQDALIRTAEHLGTGAKAAIEAEGSFRESLKTGWLTSEVLTETLNQFTMLESEENRLHLQQLGYTEEEIAAVFEMAQTATDAATKVKTFQQLIDTTKEALGSGWATSWEYIIGNMEQAQELWTGISVAINGIIDAMSNPRNEFLKTWNEEGGWEALKDTLFEIGGIISDLLLPLGQAFERVFKDVLDPISGGKAAAEASKNLLETVKAIRTFIQESEVAKVTALVVGAAFTALFEIIKIIGMVVGGTFLAAFKAIGFVLETAFLAIDGVLKGLKALYEVVGSFVKDNIFGPIAKFFTETLKLESIGKLIQDIGTYFQQFFDVFANGEDALSSGLIGETKKLISEDFANIADRVGSALGVLAEGFGQLFSVVKGKASEGAAAIFEKLQVVWERITPILEKVQEKILTAWHTLRDAFVNAGFSFDPFIDMFKGFGESFGNFFDSVFTEGFSLDKVFGLFKDLGSQVQVLIEEVGPSFSSFASAIFDAVGGNLSSAMGVLYDWLSNLGNPISSIVNGLKELFDAISTASGSFHFPWENSNGTASVSELTSVMDTANSAVTSFSNVVDLLKNPFKSISTFVSKGLNGFAAGVNEFIASLNTPEMGELVKKFTDLAILGAAGTTLYESFMLVSSLKNVSDSVADVLEKAAKAIENFGGALKAFKNALKAGAFLTVAIAIGILVASLYALTKIDLDKVQEAMPILREIALGSIVMMAAFSAAASIGEANAASIAAFSGVVMSLIALLAVMAGLTVVLGIIPESILEQGANVVGGIILMLTGLVIGLGSVAYYSPDVGKVGPILLEISGAITAIAHIIILLGKMPPNVLIQGGITVALIGVVLGGLALALEHFGGMGLGKGASGLLEMAAAIAILAGAILVVSLVDPEQLIASTNAIGILILVLGVFLVIIDKINPMGFQQAATSLIIMSVAVGIIAASIAGLAIVSKFGGDLVSAMAAIGVIMVGLIGMAEVLSGGGVWMIEAAKAMLIMAGAVAVLTAVIVVLSSLKTEDVWMSIGQLAVVMLILTAAFTGLAVVAKVCEVGLLALSSVLFGVAAVALAFGVSAALIAASIISLSQLTPEAVDNIIKAIQQLGIGLWDSKEEMALGVAGMGTALIAGILAIIPSVSAAVLVLIGALVGVLVAAAPLMGQGASAMVAGLIDGFATGLDENGPAIRDALMHLIEVILGGLYDAFSFGINEISHWLYENTGGALGKARPAAEEAAKETVDAYTGALRDGKEDVAEASEEMASGQVDGLLKSQADALGISEDTMSQLQSVFGENFNVGELDMSALEAFGVDLDALMGEMGVSSIDELTEKMNIRLDESVLDFAGLKISVKEESNDAGHEGARSYEEGWNEESADMDLSSETVASASNTAAFAEEGAASAEAMNTSFASNLLLDPSNAIMSAVEAAAAPKEFESAGEANMAGIEAGVEAGSSGLTTKTISVTRSAVGAVSQLSSYARSAAYSVGYYMSSGLLSGINSLSWKISSVASSIVSSAATAMRAAGVIESPSKVTAEIGRYLAEGLAVGMTDNVDLPVEAAKKITNSAMDSIKSQASYLSGLLDDIDENPVITPVLDLSNIEQGANRLMGLFPDSTQAYNLGFLTMPFANSVASEMVGGSSTTNYTLMVDGTVINDDPHIRGLFVDLIGELQRKAETNFG